ncbi:hypothetical protein V6N11_036184 [Hibiscus sabdariffa]|uniref:Uncharacterized protein n=1 Tax=Hibiscus sabdariffa TaxID=183260 RepID=A0ABR2RA46_9ROSI
MIPVATCLTVNGVKGVEDILNKECAFELSTMNDTMYFIADFRRKRRRIGSTPSDGPYQGQTSSSGFHSTSILVVSSTTPTTTTVSVVSPTQPSHAHVDSHAAEVVAEGTINGIDLANVSVSEPTGPTGGTTLVDLADPVVSSNEVDHTHVVPSTSTSEATNVPAALLN